MLTHKELQEKYMTITYEGELCSFDATYLKVEEIDLLTDVTELFEKGYYLTNNEATIEQLIAILESEHVPYELLHKREFWLKLKTQNI